MGGKQFIGYPEFIEGRMSLETYLHIISLLYGLLGTIMDIENVKTTLNSRDKESFGDVDLIIYATDKHMEILNILQPDLKLRKKTDSYHILFHGRQVDIKFVDSPELLIYNYMIDSFSVVSVIIGKMLSPHNMKLNNGLYYTLRIGDKNIDILLTLDIRMIFDFLSNHENPLNCEEYLDLENRDSNTLTRFLTRSRFFSSSIFSKLDVSKKINERLLNIIEYSKVNINERIEKMDVVEIFTYFNKLEEYREIFRIETEKFEKKKLFSKIFNGNIIMSLTGLSGKKLGDYMSKFPSENDMGYLQFVDHVLSLKKEDVNDFILNY